MTKEIKDMVKAVIFDLDDTLYRERDFVDQSFRSVAKVLADYLAKKSKPGVNGQRVEGADEPSYEKSPEGLFRQMIELMEQEGRGEIFNRLCERYDVDVPVQELVRIYRETKPVLSLYPDGEELLKWLEGQDIRTGLITDGNAQVQHNKIRALGLDKRLDVVLASYDLGLRKPDRGVYVYCLEKLGCTPEEAVYIGDNPLKDFIGARALGMKTARVIRPEGLHMWRTPQEGYEADITVSLLTELKEWIGRGADAV